MVNKGLAHAQTVMPGGIVMSKMSGHVSNNFQGELIVLNDQGERIYDCTTDQVNYPDPDNGHFVFIVTGANSCTLTSD